MSGNNTWLGRALFITVMIFSVQAMQFARLSEEHSSLHFPEESLTLQIVIAGTDIRLISVTPSINYTMMSWV